MPNTTKILYALFVLTITTSALLLFIHRTSHLQSLSLVAYLLLLILFVIRCFR